MSSYAELVTQLTECDSTLAAPPLEQYYNDVEQLAAVRAQIIAAASTIVGLAAQHDKISRQLGVDYAAAEQNFTQTGQLLESTMAGGDHDTTLTEAAERVTRTTRALSGHAGEAVQVTQATVESEAINSIAANLSELFGIRPDDANPPQDSLVPKVRPAAKRAIRARRMARRHLGAYITIILGRQGQEE